MLRALTKFIKGLRKKKVDIRFQETMRDEPRQSPVVVQWQSFGDATTNGTTSTPTVMINGMGVAQTNEYASEIKKEKDPGDLRVEKKPVEVVSEIVAEKPVMALDNIKQQIKIVEARLEVLKHFGGNTSDEIRALRYLQARRYYKKYEKLFPWNITTDALISALIKKYRLQDVGFGSYSKSAPIEATQELEKFGRAWEKVVDDETWVPEIRLITDYKGPEHKKDPILLAQSPFGRWWYVLGAWDREVEIVDDLIYNGK